MNMLNMKLREDFRGNKDELRDALTTIADRLEDLHDKFNAYSMSIVRNKHVPLNRDPASIELRDRFHTLDALLNGETGSKLTAFLDRDDRNVDLQDVFQAVAYDARIRFEVLWASTALRADSAILQNLHVKAQGVEMKEAPFLSTHVNAKEFLQRVQDCGRIGNVPPALEKVAPAARMYRATLGVGK